MFTQANAQLNANKAHESRREGSHSAIVDMQRMLRADVLNPETTPAHRAQAARAWKELEAQKRVNAGLGIPRPVDYAKGTKSKPQAAPMEWVEPEPKSEKPSE